MKTNKADIKKELQDLKAENLLKQFDKNQEIPTGYFENLSINVLKEIKAKETKMKIFSFRKMLLPISIAAVLIILIAIPLLKQTNQNINWNQFSENDFENYIKQNIEEFSDEEIASISFLPELSIFINTEYSNEELEEYLLDMDILEEQLF